MCRWVPSLLVISQAILYSYGFIGFDHDSHKDTGDEHAFVESQPEIVSDGSLITDTICKYIVWVCTSRSIKPHSTLYTYMSDPYTWITQDDLNNLVYDYFHLYPSYLDLMRLLQITIDRCE